MTLPPTPPDRLPPLSAAAAQALAIDIVRREAEAVARIPADNPYDRATDLIHEQCSRRGGKLVIAGVGKAGEVGRKLATTFCSTGTPAVFLHPLDAAHGDLGLLQRHDVLLAISNSGQTREILELIPLARRIFPELPLIGITGHAQSPLAELADPVLLTGQPEEVCPFGMAPTTSTTVMSVIGDVLICLQMHKVGFDRQSYAQRHHGGYLGSLLRTEAKAS